MGGSLERSEAEAYAEQFAALYSGVPEFREYDVVEVFGQ